MRIFVVQTIKNFQDMGKIFKTSEDVRKEIEELISKRCPMLDEMGVDYHIMSTTKQKTVLKVTKASPTTEYMVNKDKVGSSVMDGIVLICVYEEAWDRLDEEHKRTLIDIELSGVEVDTEKGKLNVSTDSLKKYLDTARTYDSPQTIQNRAIVYYEVIEQIAEEEAEKKKK